MTMLCYRLDDVWPIVYNVIWASMYKTTRVHDVLSRYYTQIWNMLLHCTQILTRLNNNNSSLVCWEWRNIALNTRRPILGYRPLARKDGPALLQAARGPYNIYKISCSIMRHYQLSIINNNKQEKVTNRGNSVTVDVTSLHFTLFQ